MKSMITINWLSLFAVLSVKKKSVSLEDTEITLNFIILLIQIKVHGIRRQFYFFVNVTFLLLTENRHCTGESSSAFKSP